MPDHTGFTTAATDIVHDPAPEIGVGMLGYAFMGKAHTNAYKTIPIMMNHPPAIPRLAAIAGSNRQAVAAAAARFGYERYYTDWRALIDDAAVQLFDNGGPNHLHAQPTILAAQMGKHVLCEKPLGRTAAEAKMMWDAVEKAGVKHMTAFNYRFVPAIRLIRELIDAGRLGRIFHFRASYLQEWLTPHYDASDSWRLHRSAAGSGALGDLGAHIIDLAHYLVGDALSVQGLTTTFIKDRIAADGRAFTVDVDDAFAAAIEFENGAIGTLEASRFAAGRKNSNTFEINAEKGSVRFDLERLNELQVFWYDDEPRETQGFHTVNVTESYHPWMKNWWPHGHIIGWEHTFIHEISHLLDCIVHDKDVHPIGATFEDGYRAAVVADAIIRSSQTKAAVDIDY